MAIPFVSLLPKLSVSFNHESKPKIDPPAAMAPSPVTTYNFDLNFVLILLVLFMMTSVALVYVARN